MLKYQAEKYVKEFDELKKDFIKLLVDEDLDALIDADPEQIEIAKKCINFIDCSNTLICEMAKTMDDQNEKLDKILANTKRES